MRKGERLSTTAALMVGFVLLASAFGCEGDVDLDVLGASATVASVLGACALGTENIGMSPDVLYH